MFPWRTWDELDRVALTIVSHQIKQLIVLPSVVADEAEANQARYLEGAIDGLEKAKRGLAKAFNEDFDVIVEPAPIADDALQRWRDRLNQVAETAPLHADDAAEALRREAWRVLPAREAGGRGIGARDAAIWLTVVRDHVARDEEGHFVTNNPKDFPYGDGQWEGQLGKDLEHAKYPLHQYKSIEEFLGLLGKSGPAEVSMDELARRVPSSLKAVLAVSWEVPRAIFESVDFRYRYMTEVKDARPLRVLAAKRYEDGAEGSITVVDSEWELRVDCFVRHAGADPTVWSGVEDVPVRGTIQLYLPGEDRRDFPPQIISARLKSDVSAFIREDGQLWVLEPAQPPHPASE